MTKRVLLVEDDVGVGEMLTSALRHVGCRVELAHSRDRALKIIQDGFQPELILLDYHMPGMSAADFMTEIVATKPLPRIVLMSADRDARELARNIGVPEVVEKPFDPFDIL
jgi:CheY-like chemotaxis protein